MSVITPVDLSINGRLTPDEGKLLKMAEHFDKFIVDWQMKHPSVWRDRLPKGTYQLFNGTSQKSNIFRGTLGPQAGLNGWEKIATSRKPSGQNPGVDYCTYETETYDWAFESIDLVGYRKAWRSPSFCVNDLKYIDMAKEQLGMIIRAGSQITDEVKETFNREMYVKTAVDSGRGLVMCEGVQDFVDSSTVRFSYNPFLEDANGDTYITFPVGLLNRISTLNWSFLDYLSTYLADQCPDAAMGSDSGRPVFGLMLDIMDFEKMVYADNDLREDFRYAKPQQLIAGFNMGFKVYRGYALTHDPRQMRFKISAMDATNVTAIRVKPRRATRAGTVGLIPETNPDYLQAELALGVIFMSDVIQILVPPVVSNMGEGMVFGPAPGFNGEWTWLNIQDVDTNPLREVGYFFSRYEYFVKALQYASDAVVFLYRRCAHVLKTHCAIQDEDDVGSGEIAMTAVPASTDFDATLNTVTLTLAKKLDGGIGDQVTINTDDGDDFTAYIVADTMAPTYTFAWKTGCTNEPAAVTELNDPAIVTVKMA